MTYQTNRDEWPRHQSIRESMLNANEPQKPEPQGLHAQIENIIKELDHLAEEIVAVRDCFGAVLKVADDACAATASPTQTRQTQSPMQLQLIIIMQRLIDYRMMLRDLRSRSDF